MAEQKLLNLTQNPPVGNSKPARDYPEKRDIASSKKPKKKIPRGSHKMPDGSIMKNRDHKKSGGRRGKHGSSSSTVTMDTEY